MRSWFRRPMRVKGKLGGRNKVIRGDLGGVLALPEDNNQTATANRDRRPLAMGHRIRAEYLKRGARQMAVAYRPFLSRRIGSTGTRRGTARALLRWRAYGRALVEADHGRACFIRGVGWKTRSR